MNVNLTLALISELVVYGKVLVTLMETVRSQFQGPGLGLGFVFGNVYGKGKAMVTVKIQL